MFSLKTTLFQAATIAAVTMPACAWAEASPKLTLSSSYNYSTGDYGQVIDTAITYIPVTAKLKYDAWTAKLTVPYIKITGPGVVVGGEDATVVGAPAAKGTESGLGDVIASLGYTMPLGNKGTFGDLTGKVKFPTADEDKKLGTGNTDYTVQAGLTQVYNDFYFTGNVGRKFNGSSATYRLDDVWKYSVGAGYNITPAVSAGVSYDFREGATATAKNFSQAITYATYKLTPEWATQIYLGSGFTDAAPNLTTGVQLSYKFDFSGAGGGPAIGSDD